MFVLGANAVQAASIPIDGTVSGLELCPQFICGFAAFTGTFHGLIGNHPNAIGLVSTALNHTDLPTLDKPAPAVIYRGLWQLQTLSGTIAGIVVPGGTISIASPDGKLFRVVIPLVTFDGKTAITFDGFLDHHPLIPTFGGTFKSIP
jgi:hypothetical protein